MLGLVVYLTFFVGGFDIFNVLISIAFLIPVAATVDSLLGKAEKVASFVLTITMILILINFGACTCHACEDCMSSC